MLLRCLSMTMAFALLALSSLQHAQRAVAAGACDMRAIGADIRELGNDLEFDAPPEDAPEHADLAATDLEQQYVSCADAGGYRGTPSWRFRMLAVSIIARLEEWATENPTVFMPAAGTTIFDNNAAYQLGMVWRDPHAPASVKHRVAAMIRALLQERP